MTASTGFVTHNDSPDIAGAVNGTHLVGHIEADYADLVRVFGDPAAGLGFKIRAHWTVRFADGAVATIYDWRQPQSPQRNKHWNIGGHDPHVVVRVLAALNT